jgi:hypothetical protein
VYLAAVLEGLAAAVLEQAEDVAVLTNMRIITPEHVAHGVLGNIELMMLLSRTTMTGSGGMDVD